MPESFEKTLVRIIYVMCLLIREDTIDEILYIETKEDRLVCLKTDLENIQGLIMTEKFEDTSAELLIKETVHYFKINKEINYNYELKLVPLLAMIVKIRPFNF